MLTVLINIQANYCFPKLAAKILHQLDAQFYTVAFRFAGVIYLLMHESRISS